MTCNFTSFSTVFQLYQGNGRLIMKGCVQWNNELPGLLKSEATEDKQSKLSNITIA